jgi:hypothetical protein
VEYLSQIINPVFVELKPGAIILDISSKLTDEGAVVNMQLTKIREALLKALPLTTDPMTKAHWSNLTVSIKKAMEKNK